MAKTIFEELGGKYERQGDYLLPLHCLTPRKRTADRLIRAAAFAVSERESQDYIP